MLFYPRTAIPLSIHLPFLNQKVLGQLPAIANQELQQRRTPPFYKLTTVSPSVANVHKRIVHTYQSVSHHQCHWIGVVGRCNMQSSSASSSYSAVQWCSSTAHYPVYELCKLSVIKQLHKQRGRPLLTN